MSEAEPRKKEASRESRVIDYLSGLDIDRWFPAGTEIGGNFADGFKAKAVLAGNKDFLFHISLVDKFRTSSQFDEIVITGDTDDDNEPIRVIDYHFSNRRSPEYQQAEALLRGLPEKLEASRKRQQEIRRQELENVLFSEIEDFERAQDFQESES